MFFSLENVLCNVFDYTICNFVQITENLFFRNIYFYFYLFSRKNQ